MISRILNTFFSSRIRPIFGKFDFREATFEPRPKKNIACKKCVYTGGPVRRYVYVQHQGYSDFLHCDFRLNAYSATVTDPSKQAQKILSTKKYDS